MSSQTCNVSLPTQMCQPSSGVQAPRREVGNLDQGGMTNQAAAQNELLATQIYMVRSTKFGVAEIV